MLTGSSVPQYRSFTVVLQPVSLFSRNPAFTSQVLHNVAACHLLLLSISSVGQEEIVLVIHVLKGRVVRGQALLATRIHPTLLGSR
jgi:hypothetical protein